MRSTYSILPTLRKEKRKDKLVLLMLRITVNGKRAEISAKRKIDPDRWDSKSNRMKGNKEDAKEVNGLIEILTLKLNRIHSGLVENDGTISARKIKNIFLGRDHEKKTLLEVFSRHNEMMGTRVGIDFSKSTFTRYSTTYDHIGRFLKHQYGAVDILLSNIQYSFITDLEHYLKVERKCNHNSSQKYIRNFRKIINMAVKNAWLDRDPFMAYKVKLKETRRIFLTKEELLKLEEKEIPIKRLEQVRDIFIFCCYTGLSYVDVEKLSPNQIVKANDGEFWVSIDRTKTGNASNIPILAKPLKIIETYKSCPEVISEGKLLPVISNQRMNGYLKELATLAGIDKKLTFHAARHTFATTVTLSNGIPIETIGSMLGHKNLKTTQIYAKVVQEKISNDMKKLKALLLAC